MTFILSLDQKFTISLLPAEYSPLAFPSLPQLFPYKSFLLQPNLVHLSCLFACVCVISQAWNAHLLPERLPDQIS